MDEKKMNFGRYTLDKSVEIFQAIVITGCIYIFLKAYGSDVKLILTVLLLKSLGDCFLIFSRYFKEKVFFEELLNNLSALDKKYLVLETIRNPQSYEEQLVYDAMYEINKSMCEEVKTYDMKLKEFKEFVEMWVHEVKIPVASMTLMGENLTSDDLEFSQKINKQLRKIDHYLEQILYYTRSEYKEKDYLIKEFNLQKIIKNVVINNKDDLLENKVDIEVHPMVEEVFTDSKWMEFIVNQIINNAIKYKDENKKQQKIKISSIDTPDSVKLLIEDNGIGISKNDLPRVFEKTFTGANGREKAKSTGIGLYIVKELCQSLGHKIEIESELLKYTRVTITFGKSIYSNITKS